MEQQQQAGPQAGEECLAREVFTFASWCALVTLYLPAFERYPRLPDLQASVDPVTSNLPSQTPNPQLPTAGNSQYVGDVLAPSKQDHTLAMSCHHCERQCKSCQSSQGLRSKPLRRPVSCLR